jgi:acetate kinase
MFGYVTLYRFNKTSGLKGLSGVMGDSSSITNASRTPAGVVRAAAAIASAINAISVFTTNLAVTPTGTGGAITAGCVFNLYAWTK